MSATTWLEDALTAAGGNLKVVYGGNGTGYGYRNNGLLCAGGDPLLCNGNGGSGLGLMLGYGDGTSPRPLDGTGFGSPANR